MEKIFSLDLSLKAKAVVIYLEHKMIDIDVLFFKSLVEGLCRYPDESNDVIDELTSKGFLDRFTIKGPNGDEFVYRYNDLKSMEALES